MINASGIILGFLLATAYGAAFHFIMGGPARRVVVFVLAAWIGFAAGHFLGDMINLELFNLGALHLLSASLGAWIALIVSWWLTGNERSGSQ